jgi:type IV pilus assembly protein PilM
VRLGVANARIVVRALDAPPLEDPRELAAAVRFQAQDELPMPLDAAVLDFQPLGLVETPNGPRRRVMLVAARREMVERFLTAAREAGLRPEGIDLSSFALARALHEPGTGPALLLTVGGLTNLAIVDDDGGCLFTRVAGGGLEGLAAELAERQAVTLQEAREALPRAAGIAMRAASGAEPADGEDDPLVGPARGVLAEGVRRIAGEVRGSLDFHQAQAPGGPLVQRIVLAGPAIAVPGFADALAGELGLPVEARVVDGAADGLDEAALARLSVAAGLAVEEAPA